MSKLTILIISFFLYNTLVIAMEKKPYHHLPDGTFRNPEGSPMRSENIKWSYKTFNQEKKKLDMTVPKEHVVEKEKVLLDLKKYQFLGSHLALKLVLQIFLVQRLADQHF